MFRAPLGLLSFALYIIAQPATAQRTQYTPPLPSVDYLYPNAGAKIGQGWDSFGERATAASCVEVAEAQLEASSFETHVEQIQSTYSLITKVSTSMTASYSGWGASASGSLSTSSSLSINSDDQNFLFTFRSSNGSTFAIPIEAVPSDVSELSEQSVKGLAALKSDSAQQSYMSKLWSRPPAFRGGMIKLTPAAQALRKRSRADFGRICGDGFVSAIHRGGRINLLLTQRFASIASANSLAASLSASGYGGSISANYSASAERLNSTGNLSYRVFQQGGIPLKPIAISPLGANQFFDINTILPPPDQLVANPTAFSVTVTPYENSIEDLPGGDEFPSPIKLLSISDYYVALKDEYHLVENILTTVRSSRSSPVSPFDPRIIDVFGGEKGLESLYDAIHFDLTFLEEAIAQCYGERRACTVRSAVSIVMEGYKARLADLKTAQAKATAATATPQSTDAQADRTANDVHQWSLPKIERAIERLTELEKVTKDGKLDLAFFMRFYQYLSLTPLPKAAYAGVDFVALQELKFLTSQPADKEKQLAAANDALKRANFFFRLTPWKRFFCETLNSSPMCVPESVLREIAEATQPAISADKLTAVTPPPAKPVPKERYEPIDRGPCPGPIYSTICL